jgi:hypothetical protein
MHDLTQLDPAPAGVLMAAEIDATMAYAEAEKAPATRAAAGLLPASAALLSAAAVDVSGAERAGGLSAALMGRIVRSTSSPLQEGNPVRSAGRR